MIRKVIILMMFFQIQSALGQETLEDYIDKTPYEESYYSPFSYFDSAEKKQGININKAENVLKKLNLKTLENSQYYITGKYEINNLLILFFSKYLNTENIHFAILLDKSLNIIDKLEETAYDNAEGFYSSHSFVDYNIITTTANNIYKTPETSVKKYTITKNGFKAIKDQVIIKTPSGVRVREKPNTNSSVLISVANFSDFKYLSHDFQNSSTINDNGKQINSHWLQINISDSLYKPGYVFGAFAKRKIEALTNDYKIVIEEISKNDFNKEESEKTIQQSPDKITDIEKIKVVLKNQLSLKKHDDDYYEIKKITADNGQVFDIEKHHLDECGITAYYPKYHYLLLECGHSSDYLISLKDGKDDINRIGNPDYYLSSPQNTFRLNGYYSGQSNVYFLEKNNFGKTPEYLFNFSGLFSVDYIETFFWKDDKNLYFKIVNQFYRIQFQLK